MEPRLNVMFRDITEAYYERTNFIRQRKNTMAGCQQRPKPIEAGCLEDRVDRHNTIRTDPQTENWQIAILSHFVLI